MDFDTDFPYENVAFIISDSVRDYQLNYSLGEKMENGFLIFLMRPAQVNKIKIELTNSEGIKHRIKNELTFTTPSLPEGERAPLAP